MKRMSKTILFFLFIFLFSLSVFAPQLAAQPVTQPWWLSLEQGKIKFRNGNYGDALMLFEDARRNRRAMYEQMERDLINFLFSFLFSLFFFCFRPAC
jgi:hypothetical protein